MNKQFTINCESLTDLIKVCSGLVKEGITFEAFTRDFTVICTGGF